jgi:hypothetical protein
MNIECIISLLRIMMLVRSLTLSGLAMPLQLYSIPGYGHGCFESFAHSHMHECLHVHVSFCLHMHVSAIHMHVSAIPIYPSCVGIPFESVVLPLHVQGALQMTKAMGKVRQHKRQPRGRLTTSMHMTMR